MQREFNNILLCAPRTKNKARARKKLKAIKAPCQQLLPDPSQDGGCLLCSAQHCSALFFLAMGALFAQRIKFDWLSAGRKSSGFYGNSRAELEQQKLKMPLGRAAAPPQLQANILFLASADFMSLLGTRPQYIVIWFVCIKNNAYIYLLRYTFNNNKQDF